MQQLSLVTKISALVTPLLESINLDLWGMEFIPASNNLLRIYIEKSATALPVEPASADTSGQKESFIPETAGIDECREASKLISMTLEVEDPIESAYILEVSTPGLERVFFKPEQLGRYVGKTIELTLLEPVAEFPGRKKFSGLLLTACVKEDNARFTLEIDGLHPDKTEEKTNGNTVAFCWDNVKKAKLVYVEPPKPFAPKTKKEQKKKSASTKSK